MSATLLSFCGNLLAFAALGGKTFYDLFLNPLIFRREFDEIGDLESAKRKRKRADVSTAVTFLALAISYALVIGGSVMNKPSESLTKDQVQFVVEDSLLPIRTRLETLEEEVFGKTPPGGPPGGFGARLQALSSQLDELEASGENRDARLDSIDQKITKTIRIVAELRAIVEEMDAGRREESESPRKSRPRKGREGKLKGRA